MIYVAFLSPLKKYLQPIILLYTVDSKWFAVMNRDSNQFSQFVPISGYNVRVRNKICLHSRILKNRKSEMLFDFWFLIFEKVSYNPSERIMG